MNKRKYDKLLKQQEEKIFLNSLLDVKVFAGYIVIAAKAGRTLETALLERNVDIASYKKAMKKKKFRKILNKAIEEADVYRKGFGDKMNFKFATCKKVHSNSNAVMQKLHENLNMIKDESNSDADHNQKLSWEVSEDIAKKLLVANKKPDVTESKD